MFDGRFAAGLMPSADDLDEPGDCLAVPGLLEQSDFRPPGGRTNDQDSGISALSAGRFCGFQ
ncbi:hypothetical protein D3C87_2003940 [compost metagenome]